MLRCLLLEKCPIRAGVHEGEAGGDPRSTGGPPAFGVVARRLADERAKRRAERAQAPEADLDAHLGDGHAGAPEELLGALDPALQEVLVGRLAEGLLEAANEVRPGRVRLAGERGDVELTRVLAIHQILRPAKVNVDRDRFAHPVDYRPRAARRARARAGSPQRPRASRAVPAAVYRVLVAPGTLIAALFRAEQELIFWQHDLAKALAVASFDWLGRRPG